MAVCFDYRMRATAYGIACIDKEGDKQGAAVSLSVRLYGVHHFASDTVERLWC